MPVNTDSEDLSSSDLTFKLSFALKEVVQNHSKYRTVTFIGSDCPFICVDEVIKGCNLSAKNEAFLSPANDGGYVLISLPASTPISVFQGVKWSSKDTLQSQASIIENMGNIAIFFYYKN